MKINKSTLSSLLSLLLIISLSLLVSCSNDSNIEDEPKGPSLEGFVDRSEQLVETEQNTIQSDSQNVQAAGPYDVDLSTSNFEPPVGASEAATNAADGGENPGAVRLLIATSEDGFTWSKTNERFIDQTGAPSAVVVDGTIFLYYMTFAEDYRNKIVAAVSQDEGKTWVHKLIHIDISDGHAADPTVVITDDGSLRMYLTTELAGDNHRVIRSALSEDGINFYLEGGIRIEEVLGGSYPVASSVLRIGDVWHLYTLGSFGSKNSHFVSDDGLTFIEEDPLAVNFLFSNGLASSDGYFYYGMKNTGTGKGTFSIYMATTEDGYTYDDQGVVLSVEENDLESYMVKEATVIQRNDGSYMMFYITVIP